jgi:hypothetical protein
VVQGLRAGEARDWKWQMTQYDMNETSGAGTPMPQYQCIKKVWALKIAQVDDLGTDTTTDENPIVRVHFSESNTFAPRKFSLRGKPRPQAGWYYVQYGDGYESFSPGEAFEAGYTLPKPQSEWETIANRLEALVLALSEESRKPWEWGATKVQDDVAHIVDFDRTLFETRRHFNLEGDTEIHGVFVEGSDLKLAITGNSPTAAARAEYLAAVSPANILAIVAYIREREIGAK